ncbi:DUF1360 domain-containing protein [Streptomyces globisporus]|uniref:DUF1360 domain-containing protein n=1 Tax=Streptomyces TaxID=1883 RepID=UPI0007C75749|nr:MULTISPECIES: DUF1360 domain-containing protein [Streptomyces]MYX04262.1 DUF1360 domain-containing protein [Streptomyces sp. SID8378]RUP63601.1 hypothetical protein SSPNP10_34465 [Streptomyces sp. NP10]SNB90987.1 Protein of unknown function [Streptomyces sp. PgraA7]
MLNLVELAVLAAARYRGTQLLVHDSILDPVRDRIEGWFQKKPESKARELVVALISCVYCTGWWMSGGVLATYLFAAGRWHNAPLLEARFAASWIGNAMSGARLYAGICDDGGSVDQVSASHPAAEIVDQIAGGADGQANLRSAFGKHLTIPGEGWIVVRPNSEVLSPYAPEDGQDWRVLSVREVKRQAGNANRQKFEVVLEGGAGKVVFGPSSEATNTEPRRQPRLLTAYRARAR